MALSYKSAPIYANLLTYPNLILTNGLSSSTREYILQPLLIHLRALVDDVRKQWVLTPYITEFKKQCTF